MTISTNISSKPSEAAMSTVATVTSVAVARLFTDLSWNLLGNSLGDLHRNFGATFLGNFLTLLFWNFDGNLHIMGVYFSVQKTVFLRRAKEQSLKRKTNPMP